MKTYSLVKNRSELRETDSDMVGGPSYGPLPAQFSGFQTQFPLFWAILWQLVQPADSA